MATDNLELESEVSSPSILKESDKARRLSLPVYTLNDLISFCSKIYTELGVGTYHSNKLIAEIHGVIYESIKQKFSSAQLYGLLEIKHGTGYKLTPQFLKIFKPENPEEKREGIIESLRTPEIYSKLIEDLNGHPLPSEQGLASRFIRNFNIKDYAASKAAGIFLANLKENGLVGPDNILKLFSDVQNLKVNPPITEPLKNSNNVEEKIKSEPGYIEIPVPLNGGKRAYIRIPEDYKTEDCERIAKFVEALK
jgi:hypothetical protein